MVAAIVLFESILRRVEIDGELQAVELFDTGRVTSSPAAAYHGIAGVRENDDSSEDVDEALDDARLRKLPLRLYMEVLRLTIRGMVGACAMFTFKRKCSFDGLWWRIERGNEGMM